jgi:hypothetical protein
MSDCGIAVLKVRKREQLCSTTASVRKSLCVVILAGSSGTSRRGCVNDPKGFCYICGCCVIKKQKRNTTPLVKNLYLAYFKMKFGDQDKKWDPQVV